MVIPRYPGYESGPLRITDAPTSATDVIGHARRIIEANTSRAALERLEEAALAACGGEINYDTLLDLSRGAIANERCVGPDAISKQFRSAGVQNLGGFKAHLARKYGISWDV